jgi:hypothetical protein
MSPTQDETLSHQTVNRPLHEKTPNSGRNHRVKKKECLLERELRQNRRCPPKPPRPRPSKRKDGYGNESHEREEGLRKSPFELPMFQDLFNSLPIRCNKESKPQVTEDHDGWKSESDETLNDGPKSLDKAFLHDVTETLDPLATYNKIKRVALLSTPGRRIKNAKRDKTYRQALLSAAMLTGNAVSTTASVYSAHKDDCVPIVIDTGASVSVTPVLTDFLGPLRPCATANLKGISGTTEVIGEGTVNWLVRDMFGNKRKISATAYYVPEASIRLFSPQTYFKEKKAGSLQITHDPTTLTLKYGSLLDFHVSGKQSPVDAYGRALRHKSDNRWTYL